MPTDLPSEFKGTKLPSTNRDEDQPPGCVRAVGYFLFAVILAAFVFAAVGALVWTGCWFFTHLTI